MINDITASLRLQQQMSISQLSENKAKTVTKLQTQLEDNRQQAKTMENLMESCKKLLDEDHVKGLLGRAKEVTPLIQRQEKVADK